MKAGITGIFFLATHTSNFFLDDATRPRFGKVKVPKPHTCLSPSWCIMCPDAEENVNHVLIHCSEASKVGEFDFWFGVSTPQAVGSMQRCLVLVLAVNKFVHRCRDSLESPEGCYALRVLGFRVLVGEKVSSIWDFQFLSGGEGAGLSSIMLDLKASTSKLDCVVLYFSLSGLLVHWFVWVSMRASFF